MSDNSLATDRWARTGIIAWATVGLLLLFAVVLWVVARIGSALVPFALAAVIVFLLKGSVNLLVGRGLRRTLAVVIVYMVAAGLVALAGLFVIPPLGAQFREFLGEFPTYYEEAYELWTSLQERYDAIQMPEWAENTALVFRDRLGEQAGVWSQRIATGVVTAGGQAFNFVLSIALSLVVGFYVLKDLPRLRENAIGMLPERYRADARRLYCDVVKVLGGYLRGQLIISLIVGILTAIGLGIVGVPFALIIGLITGVFNIVPYLGPIIGAAVAAVAAAFEDPIKAVWAVLIVLAVQQIDGLIISPRVMSEQVDLHPVAVIFSLLVGGTLLGFAGLLLAIPVAAVGKGVFLFYMEKRGYLPAPATGGGEVAASASERDAEAEE